MKFNLNDKESIELKYSFRSNIYFEQIQNKNVDFTNFSSNDLITLFYCVVISTLQKEKRPIISMLDFLDMIDDYNNGDKCIIEFSEWYTKVVAAQWEVLDSIEPEKPKKSTGKKKQN